MSALSQSFSLPELTVPNRIMVSPMCTYNCGRDGMATDWQFVHYGRLALGGAGLVMLEATAIEPEGRHCYSDLGIWSDAHIAPLKRIADFIRAQGAVPAIQLQHAGRKASARRMWHGGAPLDETDLQERGEAPWLTVGPSAIPFGPGKPAPRMLEASELPIFVESFAQAAARAVAAGFDVIEVHTAHGYLLNQFLSPIANQRDDDFGGNLENRMRLPLMVIEAVKAVMARRGSLWVRVSAVDGVEGGTTIEDTVVFARELKARGVDVIDVSTGGIGGAATMNRLARSPGFQVGYAERIRREVGIATVAVGLILTPEQAEDIVASDRADIVAIGRECLNNPNWPNFALTTVDDHHSYDHWQENTGWWLAKRASILRDYDADVAAQRR